LHVEQSSGNHSDHPKIVWFQGGFVLDYPEIAFWQRHRLQAVNGEERKNRVETGPSSSLKCQFKSKTLFLTWVILRKMITQVNYATGIAPKVLSKRTEILSGQQSVVK